MLMISTPSSPPNYTSLEKFQDAINEKVMVFPATNTDLKHAVLTMKRSDFIAANEGIYSNHKPRR